MIPEERKKIVRFVERVYDEACRLRFRASELSCTNDINYQETIRRLIEAQNAINAVANILAAAATARLPAASSGSQYAGGRPTGN